jgi:nitrogen regulatory protein PII-like uncharacterized protein
MLDNLQEQEKAFNELFATLNRQLYGEDIDNIIPALTTLLAEAAVMGKVNKEEFLTFVNESIEERFQMEQDQTKKEPLQ